MKKIILCAATGFEARACKQALKQMSPHPDLQIEVLETGMGPEKAKIALRSALLSGNLFSPTLVISTGFAGSLRNTLPIGATILATALISKKIAALDSSNMEASLYRAAIPFQKVQLEEVQQVELAAHEQKFHPETSAIDMESLALAETAKEFLIPFAVVRIISDNPKAPLPKTVLAFSNGGKNIRGIARGLFTAAKEPIQLTRFVARSAVLPRKLTRLWEALLPHLG